MEVNNISFNGRLYGVIGNHRTKPIICCSHGDRKFIKFFNNVAEEHPENLKISYLKEEISRYSKILVETTECPKLSLAEIIFAGIKKSQRKAIKMRNDNRIHSLIYQINEMEYDNMRTKYPFISKKELNKFETNIKKLAPENIREFLNKFFI